MVIEGIVAFSHLAEHEVYQGKSTGKFSITLSLEPEQADKLSEKGVVLHEYEGKAQRKFITRFDDFEVIDMQDNVYKLDDNGGIPYGSLVRVKCSVQNANGYNVPYFQAIRVVEEATHEEEEF